MKNDLLMLRHTMLGTTIAVIGIGGFNAATELGKSYESQTSKPFHKHSQVFLQRAEFNATSGLAKEELVNALNWLDTNYPHDSFEYKNLKANLAFLSLQPTNSSVPPTVIESTQKSKKLIEINLDKRHSAYMPIAFLWITGTFLASFIIFFSKSSVTDKV